MNIWVDADACPVVIRNILIRASNRHKIKTTFIANRPLPIQPSAFVSQWQVHQGFDEADHELVRRVSNGDLVVTQDLRLVADVFGKSAMALSPRGEWFEPSTIQSRIARRDYNEVLRDSGVFTAGPTSLSSRDSQNFANNLQRWINQRNG
ncbi:YaiI/YqxD family protein [Celerinatantimonas sp. YJH-8]|uniref:YaiI/YqxD family protein n=1 Tax=Celerinatantimonas sp. YJH-8 TaxID=3228714 RepID=UPI0038C46926